jgi:hypothetical protein
MKGKIKTRDYCDNGTLNDAKTSPAVSPPLLPVVLPDTVIQCIYYILYYVYRKTITLAYRIQFVKTDE